MPLSLAINLEVYEVKHWYHLAQKDKVKAHSRLQQQSFKFYYKQTSHIFCITRYIVLSIYSDHYCGNTPHVQKGPFHTMSPTNQMIVVCPTTPTSSDC